MDRGNKQHTYIPKEGAIFLTVSAESALMTSIVDAKKNREIAVINIPNAFIQTRVKEKKVTEIINIRRVLVDIL